MVGEPVGQHAVRQTGDGLSVPGQSRLAQHVGMVHVRDSDEHPGAGPRQDAVGQRGVGERFVSDHQHEPLLRVHHRGLTPRHLEEVGVELAHRSQECAPRRRTELVRPGQPVRGVIPHRVTADKQTLPELLQRVRAGQPARHADDRDRGRRDRSTRRALDRPAPRDRSVSGTPGARSP